MSKPLVSIIIPCYNAERWVAATLESALAQTWQNKEIIFINDGSLDGSLVVAQGFESRGVQIIDQSNRGASAARNAGLRVARGDYIQFLDADDVLDPCKIEAQMVRVNTTRLRQLLSGKWGRFTGSPALVKFRNNPLCTDLSPRGFMLLYCNQDCMMHPAAWLTPRTLIDAVGGWEERLSLNDDGEYFARLVIASESVDYCAEAISYYRSGLSVSLSGHKSRRHLESAFLATKLITEQILKFENSSEMRIAAATLWQRYAYDYYPAVPDLVAAAEGAAKALGSTSYRPTGGNVFQFLQRFIGWKLARRLQVMVGKYPA